MSAWAFIEPLLVALIVAASAVYASRRLWPVQCARLRASLTLWLLQSQRPVWLLRIGRTLAPRQAQAVSATRCGPCRGCDSGR